jgi:hypothetical protein
MKLTELNNTKYNYSSFGTLVDLPFNVLKYYQINF